MKAKVAKKRVITPACRAGPPLVGKIPGKMRKKTVMAAFNKKQENSRAIHPGKQKSHKRA